MRFHLPLGLSICLCLAWSLEARAQIRETSSEQLIIQLEEKDLERRRDAVYELVRRGDRSHEVLRALGKATADGDSQISVQALMGLARAGNDSSVVMEQLLKSLENRDNQIRYRAAGALGALGESAIEPLVSYWKSASESSRVAVAQAFAAMGPKAQAAIPFLQEGLEGKGDLPRFCSEALVSIMPKDESLLLRISEHSDFSARRIGISALAALSLPSDAAVHRLEKAARDAEAGIRETAVIAIAKSSMSNAEKSAMIETALADSAASVRAAAIVAMRKASLPAEEFSKRLAAQLLIASPDAANAILKAIAILGPDARASFQNVLDASNRTGIEQDLVSQALASFGVAVVPELFTAIQRNPSHEVVLSNALGAIGEPALDALITGMSSETELVRVAATRALGSIRPRNKSLLEPLMAAVSDKSAKVREIAVLGLIDAGKDAEFAKDILLDASGDIDEKVRAASIQSLRVFKYSEQQARGALEKGLSDASTVVRSNTLKVLGELPAQLPARLEQIIALMKSEDATVREHSAAALRKLDPKLVNDTLIQALAGAINDFFPTVRNAATETVKTLGVSDPIVLTAMRENLGHDESLLKTTLEAIAGFGDKASILIPEVSGYMQHAKGEIRVSAITSLTSIEKDKGKLAEQLVRSLEDKEWEVRQAAGAMLAKLGPDGKNAVPKLFQLLSQEEDRDFAGAALREINAAPVEAIPLLMEKLESEDRRISFYAVSLLGKIGPPAVEALPKLEAMLASPRNGSSRQDFRRKFLVEAIDAIKGETKKEEAKTP